MHEPGDIQGVGGIDEALEQRLQLVVTLSLSGTQTITPGSAVNATDDATRWETEMSVVSCSALQ